MITNVDVNCDMGEGFGAWTFGDDVDASMFSLVSSANIAAGFHAGDPSSIARAVDRAIENDVGIGVHPGFGDLVGFGRRHITATADELVNDCVYQIGAVREFVSRRGRSLQHVKLHGALYMHAAADHEFATALVAALQAVTPDLPVLCMAGTALEQVAQDQGQPVVREFYADRHYGDDGRIVFTRDVGVLSPEDVAEKVQLACREGVVQTVTGNLVPVTFESICVHSDTRGAYDLMVHTRRALDSDGVEVVSFAAPRPGDSSPASD
jgi:5-oxoprolinase (ATP-hydrolysing) subunit A